MARTGFRDELEIVIGLVNLLNLVGQLTLAPFFVFNDGRISLSENVSHCFRYVLTRIVLGLRLNEVNELIPT